MVVWRFPSLGGYDSLFFFLLFLQLLYIYMKLWIIIKYFATIVFWATFYWIKRIVILHSKYKSMRFNTVSQCIVHRRPRHVYITLAAKYRIIQVEFVGGWKKIKCNRLSQSVEMSVIEVEIIHVILYIKMADRLYTFYFI